MNQENIIEEAQKLFNEIYNKAREQIALYRKENNGIFSSSQLFGEKYLKLDKIYLPEAVAMAKLDASPNVFLYQLLNTFWNFYCLVGRDIKTPIVQFSIRPLLELCYGRIIYFVLQPEMQQQYLSVVYWLCNEAFLLKNKERNNIERLKIYKALIGELNDENDRKRFEEIQKKGFLFDKISNELKSLFPSIRAEDVQTQLEPYLVEIWGKTDIEYLNNVYLWLHQFMHANILLLDNMQKEEKDKSHVSRCALILFLAGFHLLKFTNDKILNSNKEDKDITSLKEKISHLVLDFRKIQLGV